ncbi:hypothetical protein QFZ30_004063 [Arthrobacter pascens]|uniref:LamG-like jellyroll fold domain-containing protein n=1 Tax=Arthrobacter pascens TaxID=1677 RepID=UPI00278C9F1A|nr:LamG-like jellyroll fold domain-containing protein [Arthrobacter pascens]MDQ0680681.1 hypothetical protein [Arthrobacter pascens]
MAVSAKVTCGAIAATLAGAAIVQPAAFAAPSPAESLLAQYDFDALDAGTIADTSGNNRNAKVINPASAAIVPGADAGSGALALPGGSPASSGAYVELPKSILEGRTDLTVSTRVRWNASTTPWQWLFGLGTDTTRYLLTTPYNGDGVLRSAITSAGAGAEAKVSASQALPGGAWKTLTVTLDTAQDRLTTYLDGAAVGSAPTTMSAGELLSATSTRAGYIGKSTYPDPLFQGDIDDFRVYGTALTAEQVGDLAAGDTPTPTGLKQTAFDVRTAEGVAPQLPAAVGSSFSDGFDRQVGIQWDPVDPSLYAQRGSFTVNGSAAGRPVSAAVTVVREGELSIDLGTDTGAFHGGASGTLYGLYGEGLPSNNLIDGINLRTVSTKAQDGPQHPGADALEVVKALADSSDGDVYIYMTDIHRGFPYEWPGSTPAEKMALFKEKIALQVDQVLTLEPEYQDNIVFVPFNEPEGNMFGTGDWSYNRVSWLSNPTEYFKAWDEVHALIKGKMPQARIAGPNTSLLFGQVKGFLQHTVDAGTVPDVMTWHELSDPAKIRSSVKTYRAWEDELFAGTGHAGKDLPININEYAHNYHTSVPGQMIQWVSAIEEAKVDADIAYWNIDGNLSDSAVQANRGNGQWWLLNSYAQMSGHTVKVSPPSPDKSYTLQGVATLDAPKKQARALFGGSSGSAHVRFDHVDSALFGGSVHASIREVQWTGQIGDSQGPEVIKDIELPVVDGSVFFDFGAAGLPAVKESSAYEIILTPGTHTSVTAQAPKLWQATYEAEDAGHTGTGWSRNGPEGRPADVGKFYTSGGYNVGGLRSGSDVKLDFNVSVPQDGKYDLSVFANSLNTFNLIQEQGPTNVFVTVDGKVEQEIFLTLGYKWVVWDHTDTAVDLTAGNHVISLAARSLDGTKATKGDAIVDKIDLALANPDAGQRLYEAEYATLHEATLDYSASNTSASGVAALAPGQSATFWVYSQEDGESTLGIDTLGGGTGALSVNGQAITDVGESRSLPVFLTGGINKVTVTGTSGTLKVDRVRTEDTDGTLASAVYQAEQATVNGTAAVTDLSLAEGGKAVTGIGGEPGNVNSLAFNNVIVDTAGTYALTVRYSNEEQSPASHYNPDPLARPADISVNGAESRRVLFPHTFHQNNFWEMTIAVELQAGTNSIAFSSEELPNFDGETYISDTWPGILLRSSYAPNIDRISVTPYKVSAAVEDHEPDFTPAYPAKKLNGTTEQNFGLEGQTVSEGGSDVSLKNLPANEWVYAFLDSSGLGWYKADAAGTVIAKTPQTTKSGNYRIVVFNSEGNLIGWDSLNVKKPK